MSASRGFTANISGNAVNKYSNGGSTAFWKVIVKSPRKREGEVEGC